MEENKNLKEKMRLLNEANKISKETKKNIKNRSP